MPENLIIFNVLNSQRIFGTCQHFSTKCKRSRKRSHWPKQLSHRSWQEHRWKLRRLKINHVPKHLSIQSFSRGSKGTSRQFRALVGKLVQNRCYLIVCVLCLYMWRCTFAFNINIDICWNTKSSLRYIIYNEQEDTVVRI